MPLEASRGVAASFYNKEGKAILLKIQTKILKIKQCYIFFISICTAVIFLLKVFYKIKLNKSSLPIVSQKNIFLGKLKLKSNYKYLVKEKTFWKYIFYFGHLNSI